MTGAAGLLVVWALAGSPGADEPPALVGSFAFANERGDELLALDELPEQRRIVRAVCDGGRTLPVKWRSKQERGVQDSGRRTARNFRNTAGDLFRLGANVAEDEVCLIVDAGFLATRTILALRRDESPCDTATRERLAFARGREVSACWLRAADRDGRRLVLVEFARQGAQLLASFGLLDPDGLAFHDYPARWNEEQISCWRVDDECRLLPHAFSVLFAYRTAAGRHGLALAWGGPEGESLELIESEGTAFRTLIEGYRYWAPQ